LAENGANVNYRYARGHSPLLEAAANGRLEIVKVLIAHGADPHARTDAGKTALDFATERGHDELSDYLQAHGLLERPQQFRSLLRHAQFDLYDHSGLHTHPSGETSSSVIIRVAGLR